jgi:hypothetical protein
MQLATEAAFLSLIAVTFIFVLIGVCLSFISARLPKLTGTVQRNVLRHKRALPNGDWRLLRGPIDIYMVRSSFTASRKSQFSRVTAFHFHIRYPTSDGLYPQHSMGPQWDCRSWLLLHCPGHS